MRLLLASVVFFFVSGCSDVRVLDADAYARECESAADCFPIVVGNQCTPCACPSAAIAESDRPLYEADRNRAQRACGSFDRVACGPCPEATVACERSADAGMKSVCVIR